MQVKGSQDIGPDTGQGLDGGLDSGKADQRRFAIYFVDENIQIAVVSVLAVDHRPEHARIRGIVVFNNPPNIVAVYLKCF